MDFCIQLLRDVRLHTDKLILIVWPACNPKFNAGCGACSAGASAFLTHLKWSFFRVFSFFDFKISTNLKRDVKIKTIAPVGKTDTNEGGATLILDFEHEITRRVRNGLDWLCRELCYGRLGEQLTIVFVFQLGETSYFWGLIFAGFFEPLSTHACPWRWHACAPSTRACRGPSRRRDNRGRWCAAAADRPGTRALSGVYSRNPSELFRTFK